MKKITREQFDKLSSDLYFNVSLGKETCYPCPDCKKRSTVPNSDCPCRELHGRHIMKYHHVCKKLNQSI